MVTKRGKRKGGINWETEIGTCTVLCEKQITNKNLLYNTETQYSVMTYVGKESKKEWLCVYVRDFPDGPGDKESTCNAGAAGDMGSILAWGRYPELVMQHPLQYSCLKKFPWSEEPGRLQSKMSKRAGHDWATEHAHICTCITDSLCFSAETNTTL